MQVDKLGSWRSDSRLFLNIERWLIITNDMTRCDERISKVISGGIPFIHLKQIFKSSLRMAAMTINGHPNRQTAAILCPQFVLSFAISRLSVSENTFNYFDICTRKHSDSRWIFVHSLMREPRSKAKPPLDSLGSHFFEGLNSEWWLSFFFSELICMLIASSSLIMPKWSSSNFSTRIACRSAK